MVFIKISLFLLFTLCIAIFTNKPLRYKTAEYYSGPIEFLTSLVYERPWVNDVEIISSAARAFYLEKNTLIPIKYKQTLTEKKTILQTENHSWILLKFGRNSLIKVLPNSQFEISFDEYGDPSFELQYGSVFLSISKEENNSLLKTKFALFSGNLTDFLISTSEQGKTTIAVLSGRIITEVAWNKNRYYVYQGQGSAVDSKGNALTAAEYDWVKQVKWDEITYSMYVDDLQWKYEKLLAKNSRNLTPFELGSFPFIEKFKENIVIKAKQMDSLINKKKPGKDNKNNRKKSNVVKDISKSVKRINRYYKKLEEEHGKD